MKTWVKVLVGLVAFGAVGRVFASRQSQADGATEPARHEAAAARRTERQRVRDAQAMVRARLKDPESAEFSNVTVAQHGDTVATCGYVNAKNSFGGFTGKKSFLVVGSLAATEDDLEPGVFTAMWNRVCVE